MLVRFECDFWPVTIFYSCYVEIQFLTAFVFWRLFTNTTNDDLQVIVFKCFTFDE